MCPRSINVESSGAISHQSDEYWGGCEQEGGKEKKNVKFIDEQQLPSKKRKNGMISSSIAQMEESPNKKLEVLTRGSCKHTVAAPKRIVSVRTTSEEALVIIEF